ncbi:HEAT repeat domain-containing protein, partial [Kineococcus glutinatus]|uniref:HEAT repeat domain-containing protein n=1 Tax=Kineococcus glutinatus TaxID=1070872 RepID=UPI0031ECD2FC
DASAGQAAEATAALLAAVLAEVAPTVLDAVRTTLAGTDDPAVARALGAWLGSDDTGLRNAVVVALQTMPTGVAGVVTDLLASPDARVRTLTVMVLSTLPHPRVGQWLALVAEHDTDANIVAAAVDAAQLLDSDLAADLAATGAARFPTNPYLGFLASVATTAAGGR